MVLSFAFRELGQEAVMSGRGSVLAVINPSRFGSPRVHPSSFSASVQSWQIPASWISGHEGQLVSLVGRR
jgi:hypothetical protein